MSRIRSIHPKILTDEAFMDLTVTAPLGVALLIGLWMEADDNGVFEWKPLTLKARILPAAPIDIAALLVELECRKFIKRYAVGGREYGAVRNFKRYQRPKKPNAVHPVTPLIEAYVGTGDEITEDSSELFPHHDGTPSPNPPQREEGGDNMEEVKNAAPAALDLETEFENWWKIYPKKADKGHARKEFARARKAGTPLETLSAGAERYRDDPKRHPDFTKNGGTWLTGECWNDTPATAPPVVPFTTQEAKDAMRHMAYAELIKKGISPGLQFSNSDRRKMIATGLITPEQCERAGCAA